MVKGPDAPPLSPRGLPLPALCLTPLSAPPRLQIEAIATQEPDEDGAEPSIGLMDAQSLDVSALPSFFPVFFL